MFEGTKYMCMAVETQMVDFEALERDPSFERRGSLMKHVVSLFALTADQCPDELLQIYDAVLVRLATMVEQEARRYASETLARLERAPKGFISALAEDEIQIAAPVLRFSPVLSDDDLIRVADAKPSDYASCIAERAFLSESVTDIVAHKGDDSTRRRLAANPGARFGDVAARILSHQVARDEALQHCLVKRNDMPKQLIAELIKHATQEVRAQLVAKEQFSDLNVVEDAALMAEERLGFDFLFDGFEFEAVEADLDRVQAQKSLDELDLVAAIQADDLARAVCLFARLCGVERMLVMDWLSKRKMEPLVVSARAFHFADSTVQNLLRVGPLQDWLPDDVRSVAMMRFETLKIETAQRIFSYWDTSASAA